FIFRLCSRVVLGRHKLGTTLRIKMNKRIYVFITLILFVANTSFGAPSYLFGDGIKNPSRTKTFNLPSIDGSSDDITTTTNSATLLNKTLKEALVEDGLLLKEETVEPDSPAAGFKTLF